MLKAIYRILPFAGVLLTLSFLGWLLTLHGTTGLLHLNSSFRLGFIVILIAVIFLVGLAIWQILMARKKRNGLEIWFIAPIILLTVLEIIFPVSGLVYLNSPVSPPTEVPQPQLFLSDGKSNTGVPDLAVVNYTANPIIETLIWGTGETNSIMRESNTTKQHVFTLSNLNPDTDYWYQIDDGARYEFSTPAVNENTLHFAVASDFHYGAGNARSDLTAQMLKEIANPTNKYDYLFSAGDLVNYGFSDAQWQTALQGLTPVISEIPTTLIAGNHDALFTGLKRYEYYCYPQAMVASSSSPLWHRYDVGKVHFLCLNIEWSAECYTAEQAAWLEEQLKSIPQDDWIIVMGHGFYYASGAIVDGWKWYDNPETIKAITPIFEKYGVDMVFSGHVHQLELLQQAGVTYVISGAFGGILDPAYTYKSPASLWYASGQFGFADITLNGNSAEIIFRDPDYQVLKAFTLNK
jgi:predicted MPP superfamily phosphohydrolase